ncbi:MAG: lytic transglycosylase domain-containing protein [Deltaproteobacteria bacterium]|jgi:soluble lytic murein transglycosylase|nr:lytic transglycosylase domain-containing protein [Deltaproteobacteria bacterium]
MTRIGKRCFFIGIYTFLCIMTMVATPLYADIYVYVDNEGVLHFTNVPTSPKSYNYKVYIKETPKKPLESYNENLYDHFISEASHTHGVPFTLLKALIKTESDFNPTAVSSAGARGLMQLMPENIKTLKIKNPFDPRENVMGGTRYLKQLINRFNGKLPLALAAYNAGPGVVEKYQRIPPFQETENYVKQVMKYYSLFNES